MVTFDIVVDNLIPSCCLSFIYLFIKGLSDIELNTLDTLAELGLAGVGTELPPGAGQAALLGPAVVSVTIIIIIIIISVTISVISTRGVRPRRENLLI